VKIFQATHPELFAVNDLNSSILWNIGAKLKNKNCKKSQYIKIYRLFIREGKTGYT
jgi:hypothetical protein